MGRGKIIPEGLQYGSQFLNVLSYFEKQFGGIHLSTVSPPDIRH